MSQKLESVLGVLDTVAVVIMITVAAARNIASALDARK